MPKVAWSDTFLDWDQLLGVGAGYAGSVPGLQRRLDALRELAGRARELEFLRQRLQAERQVATQELHTLRDEGKDLAMEIRNLMKSALGHHNQELTAFNIRPRRPSRQSRLLRSRQSPPATAREPKPDEGQ